MNKLDLAKVIMGNINKLPDLGESELSLVQSVVMELSDKGFHEYMFDMECSPLPDIQTAINIVSREFSRYEQGFSRIYSLSCDDDRKCNKLRRELLNDLSVCLDILDNLYALYDEESQIYSDKH